MFFYTVWSFGHGTHAKLKLSHNSLNFWWLIWEYSEAVAYYNASVASHINSVQAVRSRVECEGSQAKEVEESHTFLGKVRSPTDAWLCQKGI